MYDASSRKHVRKAEKASRLAEVQRAEVLASIMSVTNGRAWMWDILESCHLFNDPFTGDALVEAYGKGERNVGLRLLAEIMQHCPDNFILAMREANERRAAAERDRSQDTNGGVEGSDFDRYRDGEGNPAFDGYNENRGGQVS